MVWCSKCKSWFHYTCIHLTEQQIARIHTYYCEKCEDGHSIRTIWHVRQPKRGVVEKWKRDYFFDISAIIGHRRDPKNRQKRKFKIEWQGRYKDTWEPEEYLVGCLDTLQQYCSRKQIALSEIEGIYGASHDDKDKINQVNWVTLDQVIKCFEHHAKQRKLDVLTAKRGVVFDSSDSINFFGYDHHCFVVLYDAANRIGYLADGINAFVEDSEYALEIRQRLGFRIIPCKYNKQSKVDHCGSSAVLIGLELARSYKVGIRPDNLTPTKYLLSRVTSQMHKFKSHLLNKPPLHKRKTHLECEHCGKTFWQSKRKQFLAHVRKCSAKSFSQLPS